MKIELRRTRARLLLGKQQSLVLSTLGATGDGRQARETRVSSVRSVVRGVDFIAFALSSGAA